MQILTEVVEFNEDNVQRPTETTEEWEAAPGGVFAPVRPDTSTGGKGPGKAPKAAHRRVLPYRRPSPKEPSTVAGAPACAGIGAVVESMGDRLEKVTLGGGGRFLLVVFCPQFAPPPWRHDFIDFFLCLILISDTPATEIPTVTAHDP